MTGVEEISIDQESLPYGYFENPFPVYQRMREESPVFWSDNWGCWILTRYPDVQDAVKNYKRYSSVGRVSGFLESLPESMRDELKVIRDHFSSGMINSDPPEHKRVRSLVNKAFTVTSIDAMEPFIRKVVDELLDDVQDRGSFDIISDFSYLLPTTLIAYMMGVPVSDREKFNEWCDAIFYFQSTGRAEPGPSRQCEASLQGLRAYFREQLERRKKKTGVDLVSRLAAAEDEGSKLTEGEIMASLGTLLIGGYETTMSLMGSGVVALLQNPDQLDLLRQDPSIIPNAVEEFLRFDSPAQRLFRVALEDIELDGGRIQKGQLVAAMLGAANHDPAVFPDPEQLDVRRKNIKHLAFGSGVHLCIGAPLARLELKIAFETLIRRFPNLRLDPERPPRWRTSAGNRGPKSLPVLI
jgi:pimeloyl-[acyl-carrier protein] synthase